MMSSLPTGTVTFLFTDIEGSTKLWERYPEAMKTALARHDSILRKVVETQRGHIIKTTGDGMHAVFANALDGVSAVVAGQRSLVVEAWRETGPLRVRMALYTGYATQREGDYYGTTLNRAARLMSIAHGGQILLSDTTAGLVRDDLIQTVRLRDLGEHRLKDLTRPEHVYQLVAADLPADFPPLKSLNAFAHNLPVQLTSFIGREREMGEVKRLLATTHLLTLAGPGGTGKTRLSLQVAGEVLDAFKDGVWFVELSPISDPSLVAPTIARALGVSESPGKPVLDVLKDYLREKDLLLVLDNFEQVIEAAPLVKALLTAAPKLKMLISSRSILRIAGEREYAVPLLALPDPKHLPPLEQLTQYEALRLFIERAQAVRSDFVITNENAPAVAEICYRLEGLPLAIELAAARVRLLPPQKMLAQLNNKLKLLVSAARDLPARQQTLRGAIDWSFNLLAPAEQALFRRLAVFVGGATLEAIEAMGNAENDIAVFDGIESLVDKSLLKQNERDGEPRFVMLEMIREYAREKLIEADELSRMLDSHLHYFLGLAEGGRAPSNLGSPISLNSLELNSLESEDDNLGAALAWGLEQHPDLALRLAAALGSFWMVHGYLTTGRHWLTASLTKDAAAPMVDAESKPARQAARALALGWAGSLAAVQGDPRTARPLLEEAVNLSRQLGDRQRLEMSLTILGLTAFFLDDIRVARAALEESIELGRALGNKADLAVALTFYGLVVFRGSRDLEAVRTYFDESVKLGREIGDKVHTADTLNHWGLTAFGAGEYEEARRSFQDSMAISEAAGNAQFVNMSRSGLADVGRRLGDCDSAEALYRESFAEWRRLGNRGAMARVMECLAFVAKAHAQVRAADQPIGSLRRAALLLGAADSLRATSGNPMTGAEREEYELEVAGLRALLDTAALSSIWEEGRRLTPEQAIGLAYGHDQK